LYVSSTLEAFLGPKAHLPVVVLSLILCSDGDLIRQGLHSLPASSSSANIIYYLVIFVYMVPRSLSLSDQINVTAKHKTQHINYHLASPAH